MNDAQTQPAPANDEILKARARALARPPIEHRTTDQTLDVIEFRLAQEHYAVEQACVREVHPLEELTPLPCTPAFMLGIINIRGQIISVIDIKKFFELPDTGITDMHAVIIVHADGIELGILADAVTGARTIALDSLQPSLPTLTGVRAQYLKGVSDQHLAILDVRRILMDPKIIVNENMETI